MVGADLKANVGGLDDEDLSKRVGSSLGGLLQPVCAGSFGNPRRPTSRR